MDEDRLSGTAKNLHGQTQKAEDSVQDLYGQAKDGPPGRLSAQWGKCPPPWKTPFATTSKMDRIRPLPSL
jgi:hypothetical protein